MNNKVFIPHGKFTFIALFLDKNFAFKKLASANINAIIINASLIKEMIILASFLFEITFGNSENQPTNSSFHVVNYGTIC